MTTLRSDQDRVVYVCGCEWPECVVAEGGDPWCWIEEDAGRTCQTCGLPVEAINIDSMLVMLRRLVDIRTGKQRPKEIMAPREAMRYQRDAYDAVAEDAMRFLGGGS